MATMNISLPDSLKSYVDSRVSKDGYGTASEYFRETSSAVSGSKQSAPS